MIKTSLAPVEKPQLICWVVPVPEYVKILSAVVIGIAFGVLFVTGAERDKRFIVIVTRGTEKECFVRSLKRHPEIHCANGWIEAAGVTVEAGAKVEVIAAK